MSLWCIYLYISFERSYYDYIIINSKIFKKYF